MIIQWVIMKSWSHFNKIQSHIGRPGFTKRGMQEQWPILPRNLPHNPPPLQGAGCARGNGRGREGRRDVTEYGGWEMLTWISELVPSFCSATLLLPSSPFSHQHFYPTSPSLAHHCHAPHSPASMRLLPATTTEKARSSKEGVLRVKEGISTCFMDL